ncbi:hypothetical protein NET03_11995 [Thermomicrobium sp. CFH 73360]|uniref:hypothetical protein n=1 Tax=Thermomicrobium sp. CFH 73360 TaxID=2951987 RepID=UPI0020776B06|nr:hypothetical protein [Thermomicrobium sp. CFH 73360]MCM8747245.1 hypothetical protein [Thermomicrobium sp. CFH 73360]
MNEIHRAATSGTLGSRRQLLHALLGISAGLVSGSLLSACGQEATSPTSTTSSGASTASTSTPATSGAPTVSSGSGGKLVVYSWYQKWIKEQAIPAFEQETGITVTYLGAYASNDEWWAKLPAGES